MTVLDDAESYITRIAPRALCDDCLALKLGITLRRHANHKSRGLAKCEQFERQKGEY